MVIVLLIFAFFMSLMINFFEKVTGPHESRHRKQAPPENAGATDRENVHSRHAG